MNNPNQHNTTQKKRRGDEEERGEERNNNEKSHEPCPSINSDESEVNGEVSCI
jgi:hypothetical protein